MRKYFILLLLMFFTNCITAEETQTLETIHLNIDGEDQIFNIEKQRINNDRLEFQPYQGDTQPEIKNSDDPSLYTKKNTSFKKEKKINDKMSVGAKYDTTLAPESVSQTRTLYSKYKMTDKMSVDTSYKTNSAAGIESQTKGTVSIAPEYRINKHVLLRNMFGRNFGDNSNKTEVQMQIQPFKDDRMDLSVGAGQVQRDNNGATSSQVNFGTNFKF